MAINKTNRRGYVFFIVKLHVNSFPRTSAHFFVMMSSVMMFLYDSVDMLLQKFLFHNLLYFDLVLLICLCLA